jgi:hypothetical protein
MRPNAAMALFVLCAAMLVQPSARADVANYTFPIHDAVKATVLGSPPPDIHPLAKDGPIAEVTYSLKPVDKDALEEHFPALYRRGRAHFDFSLAYQKGPAPLIVSIAGTGAAHNTGKAQLIKRIFQRAGYHVLSISSPSRADFILMASSTDHVGISPRDAEDLYAVIQRALALAKEKKKLEITDIYLTGYSLGGTEAAFVAALDAREKKIGFKKVLLVNPSVNLFTSISNLTNIVTAGEVQKQTGVDRTSAVFDPILRRVADYYRRSGGDFNLSGDALYKVANGIDLTDFEYRALIRVSFGLSTADLVFATDVMNDYGYVVPAGEGVSALNKRADLWFKRSLAWNFVDYFHLMVMPYWRTLHPGATDQDAINAFSLYAVQDYLRHADDVHVIDNLDDIILGPGDIDFLRKTFGDRATIYPYGGHCGNMNFTTNVNDMVAFFGGVRRSS